MGGFVGGIVKTNRCLDSVTVADLASKIGRRSNGSPFVLIHEPHESEAPGSSDTTSYLISAQESGFSPTGSLPEEEPVGGAVIVLDGFPEDRSISEMRNHGVTQRTVLEDPKSLLRQRLTNDNGPFVFASINLQRDSMTIGRDYLGRKTIYIYRTPDEVWFSSDLPTLLSVPGIPRRPNPAVVYEYLRHGSWNTIDATMFADISQVSPGKVIEISLSDPSRERVIEEREFVIPEIAARTFEDAVIETRAAFLASIRSCIPDNRDPIGASLSGGIDSSSIVAAMREIAGSEREIHSFSFITPENPRINEEPWIDIASRAANTVSHKVQVTSGEFVRNLPIVTAEYGEPLLGVSQYLQYRVANEARATGIRTILDGISGDPITGGHDYQVFDRLRKSIADRNIAASVALARTVLRHLRNRPTRAYMVQALAQLPDPLHHLIRKALRLQVMPSWMDSEWFSARNVSGVLPHAAKGAHPYQEHVISTIVESRTIRVAERNAAINAASSRMPFLDSRFVAHMLRLPEALSLGNDGEYRVAFSEAMRPYVPEQILNRTNKIGFNAPDNKWLHEQRETVNDILLTARERGAPFHLQELPSDISGQQVNRYDIVRCIALAVWAEIYDVNF